MTINRFSCFKRRVQALLNVRHGITLDDCADDGWLRAALDAGDAPEDFVEWIAEKYDLDRIDQDPYGGLSAQINRRR